MAASSLLLKQGKVNIKKVKNEFYKVYKGCYELYINEGNYSGNLLPLK